MKKIFLLVIFLIMSVEACAEKSIVWKTNGKVLFGNKVIKLKMQNAYSAYITGKGIYVIGFEIDNQGNNRPTVSWVKDSNAKPAYWQFDNVLQQVFEFNDFVYLLDIQGNVYIRSKAGWKKSTFDLVENSKVIDTENGLLACYPSSFAKSSPGSGACYLSGARWKVKVNWRDVEPVVCSGLLVVVDTQQQKKMLKKYSVSNGKLVDVKEINIVPDDLCK